MTTGQTGLQRDLQGEWYEISLSPPLRQDSRDERQSAETSEGERVLRVNSGFNNRLPAREHYLSTLLLAWFRTHDQAKDTALFSAGHSSE